SRWPRTNILGRLFHLRVVKVSPLPRERFANLTRRSASMLAGDLTACHQLIACRSPAHCVPVTSSLRAGQQLTACRSQAHCVPVTSQRSPRSLAVRATSLNRTNRVKPIQTPPSPSRSHRDSQIIGRNPNSAL